MQPLWLLPLLLLQLLLLWLLVVLKAHRVSRCGGACRFDGAEVNTGA